MKIFFFEDNPNTPISKLLLQSFGGQNMILQGFHLYLTKEKKML